MKRLLVLCSLFGCVTPYADELGDILSANKNLLFDYELQSNTSQSDMLKNAWIEPIMLQYTKSYSEQFAEKTVQTGSFSVGINQPIFRSGGIYYAMKYADTLRESNEVQIRLKRREMIVQAVKLLFEMSKGKLEQEKLRLLVKNDIIDIYQKRENYESGMTDSSFLDQALLKKNRDETQQIALEMNLAKLKQRFGLLSDKDPEKLKLPKLHLISASRYRGGNLELVREKLKAKEKGYNAKMTWAKYLPSISVQGHYTDADPNPLFAAPNSGLKEQYFSYGFTISMPLSVNMFSDIESNRLVHLKAQTDVIERREAIDAEYSLVKKKIALIEKQIALSKQDEKLYAKLYKRTKEQMQAGEKTKFDMQMMSHSLSIRELDKKIYYYDKQIELLGLYAKVESEI